MTFLIDVLTAQAARKHLPSGYPIMRTHEKMIFFIMTTFESKAILNAFRRQNWRGRKMMQYYKEFFTNQREGGYKNKISINPSKIKTTALNQYYVLTNHNQYYEKFCACDA